jgi:membrane-associated phospholipid phosphatase
VRAAPACALLLLAFPAAARAQVSAAPPPELSYNLTVDATVTGAGIAYWIGTELLKSHLAPSNCRWCDPPGFDSSVRDALKWRDTNTANVISYIVPLGAEPLVVFGLNAFAAYDQRTPGAAGVDALLISESVAIAMVMNQTVKFIVGRERPFVHALPDADKSHTGNPSDNNLSFYSGHATFAFALAVGGGTIASMRRYRLAPIIWGAGVTLAVATAYLRVAADRHYASDVTVGALLGSASGFAVPYLFHRPGRVTVAPVPVEHGGAALAVRGVF